MGPGPSADETRSALSRILASKTFQTARRSGDILRFVVEETLAGRASRLKEYAIGADALGRGASFDPRSDPIARVEASRLRSRLDLYNATEGKADPVVISLPKGGYVPEFSTREPTAVTAEASPIVPAPGLLHKRPRALIAGAALLGAGIVALAAFALSREMPPAAARRMHLDFPLGAPVEIANQVGNSLAISPDGQVIVFVGLAADGGTRLYTRRLDQLEATELPGTLAATAPFISPDGRWVGFTGEGKIKKTLVEGGGTPIILAEVPDFLGAAWGKDGYIVATLDRSPSLWRIPENGGDLQKIAAPEGVADNPRWPQILPGGSHALVTSTTGQAADTSIDIVRLSDGQRTTIIEKGAYGRYADGHILFTDRGTLFSAAFDLGALKVIAAPEPIVRQVSHDFGYGFAQYAASDTGALVYLRDPSEGLSTIQRLTPSGAEMLLATPGRYLWPRVSPDGSRIAFSRLENSDYDLYELELGAGQPKRLTSGRGGQSRPVWTDDGKWLLWQEDAQPAIWARRTDDTGAPVKLIEGIRMPSSVRDGRLAWFEMSETTGFDLWTAPLVSAAQGLGVGEPQPFLRGATMDIYPRFSPDGRWVAYSSGKSGPMEIYVRAWPDDGKEVRVSFTGGRIPAWSSTPGQLLYEAPNNRIMSVRYAVKNGNFDVVSTQLWPGEPLARTGMLSNFDADPSRPGIIALVPVNLPPGWRADHLTFLGKF